MEGDHCGCMAASPVNSAPAERFVLAVDDEQEILDSIRAFLEGALPGVKVLTATSGEQALRVLSSQQVNLVLADYRMPVQDGLAFLIAAERQAPDVPRIMMTAYPEAELAVNALHQAHVQRFLVKPIDPGELRRHVAKLLG